MAGAAPHKVGDVETNLCLTNTHNKSGFAISAVNKYMLGSGYPTLGAPKMRRYPPSTIYRYLDTIYTDNPDSQLIQT